MEWIASVQTVLQEWEKNNSQVLQELQDWFRAIPLDKKWEIVLMLLACVWIIRTVNERSGASKKAKRAKNKGSHLQSHSSQYHSRGMSSCAGPMN